MSFASMRSSSSGTVASAIGERSERKQNAPNSQSIVSSLTRGVTSSCSGADRVQ